jgi:paraquat-inducible protein A
MAKTSHSNGTLTAARAALVPCHSCGLLSAGSDSSKKRHRCPRCGAILHLRKPASLSRTWALVITALILYVPANVLPVTQTTSLGHTQVDTIFSGVYYFMITGSWHIATIIFVASVVVPLLKLVALIYLLISVHFRSTWRPVDRTRLYRLTELVGRWSMVDIFVISVLVALVKMGALANIEAEPGGVFFAAVVVITMLAAECFDPRLIWDAIEEKK